jgi:hypothetical protein
VTRDDLVHWLESDDLVGTSPVIADVDGLKLPIERVEVVRGRLVIFVDMYKGLDYEPESVWRRREEGEQE